MLQDLMPDQRNRHKGQSPLRMPRPLQPNTSSIILRWRIRIIWFTIDIKREEGNNEKFILIINNFINRGLKLINKVYK